MRSRNGGKRSRFRLPERCSIFERGGDFRKIFLFEIITEERESVLFILIYDEIIWNVFKEGGDFPKIHPFEIIIINYY